MHALAFVPDLEDSGGARAGGEGSGDLRRARRCAPSTLSALRQLRPRERLQLGRCRPTTESLCLSCRLTRVDPRPRSQPGHTRGVVRLEVAKRRLVYSLLRLRLPVGARRPIPSAAWPSSSSPRPPTRRCDRTRGRRNHDQRRRGRRRRARAAPRPAARAVSHVARAFRHEIGHYYWERLLAEDAAPRGFRALLRRRARRTTARRSQRHYDEGAPADGSERFVSAYASAHPWEDWAETWAHYLHMTRHARDRRGCGLSLRPRRADEPSLRRAGASSRPRGPFEQKIEAWFPLTYVLNNLNRGLGLADGYRSCCRRRDREAALRARRSIRRS